MSIKLFISGVAVSAPAKTKEKRKRTGHIEPQAFAGSLDEPGKVRVANLMAMLDLSHSALYERMKKHKVPPPDGYDGSPERPYWHTSTIKAFVTDPVFQIRERLRDERRAKRDALLAKAINADRERMKAHLAEQAARQALSG